MCGIVGYIGKNESVPILIDSLKRLEYRGYDSSGIAVLENGNLKIYKEKGKISELEKILPNINSNMGIGHTRWATHGKPNKINSHPHVSGNIAVVHNGIIENYQKLKEKLIEKGYEFVSDTDTEVIAHLINYHFSDSLKSAVISAIKEIKGSYAIAVMNPYELIAARKHSPLIIGIGDGENFIASDIPAILKYTKKVVYLDDMELAAITPEKVEFFDINNNHVDKKIETIEWNLEDAEKSGYEHFMLKEIHEQPSSLHQTISHRISEIEGNIYLEGLSLTKNQIKVISRISIIACGTSFNAGLLGKYILESLTDIHVDVEIASEFRYASTIPNPLVIAISQSGETADTLEAVRKAKTYGSRILAITNIVGSNLTRQADDVLYTRSGPEIGVAATKTFTSQIGVLYLLAFYIGKIKGKIDTHQIKQILVSIKKIPSKILRILDNSEKIHELAMEFKDFENFFYIGRNLNYPVALEGALKLKEISYIHAECYAAGELKHGPIALISKNTPVLVIATGSPIYDKIINNIKEIKARDSPVIALADEDDIDIEKYVDAVIRIPCTEYILSPILSSVALQLFAYYIAKERNCSIDNPRNLAKCVTVE